MPRCASKLREAQKRSVWQVLATRLKVVIARSDGATLSFTLAVPPTLVLSVAAPHLWYALCHGKLMVQTWKQVDGILAIADEQLRVAASDGAYTNTKLVVGIAWRACVWPTEA